MHTESSSKTGLFLIELIISIFFFIVAAAICTQTFVKAHILSNDTINLNHAFLWVQNVSSLFTEGQGDSAFIKDTYSAQDCISYINLPADNNMLLLFDTDWHPVTNASNAQYLALCSFSADTQFAYVDIYISACEESFFAEIMQASDYSEYATNASRSIYQITLQKHIPRSPAKGGVVLE